MNTKVDTVIHDFIVSCDEIEKYTDVLGIEEVEKIKGILKYRMRLDVLDKISKDVCNRSKVV